MTWRTLTAPYRLHWLFAGSVVCLIFASGCGQLSTGSSGLGSYVAVGIGNAIVTLAEAALLTLVL
jgi:hypothetical protein